MAALQQTLPSAGTLHPPPPSGGMTWNGAETRSGALHLASFWRCITFDTGTAGAAILYDMLQKVLQR